MAKQSRFVRRARTTKVPPANAVSPTDVRIDVPEGEELEEAGAASFVWSPNPGFAAYLRRVREAVPISMRQAAPALGVSYAWLARIESGGYASPPSLQRLHAMAELYNVDPREMLHEAGVRIALPHDLDAGASVDARFRAVVLHPDLRPPLLEADALAYIPDRVKRQWLDFAHKLAHHPDPKALLTAALADARNA
jgi:transcriptional regulator with XRE-family HTH domain